MIKENEFVYMSNGGDKESFDTEYIFWSNEDGWGDLETAERYNSEEIINQYAPIDLSNIVVCVCVWFAKKISNKLTLIEDSMREIYKIDEHITRIYPVMCFGCKLDNNRIINVYGTGYYLFTESEYIKLCFTGEI